MSGGRCCGPGTGEKPGRGGIFAANSTLPLATYSVRLAKCRKFWAMRKAFFGTEVTGEPTGGKGQALVASMLL